MVIVNKKTVINIDIKFSNTAILCKTFDPNPPPQLVKIKRKCVDSAHHNLVKHEPAEDG